jgi:phosphoribosylformylglycinamidine cyclo-ligase
MPENVRGKNQGPGKPPDRKPASAGARPADRGGAADRKPGAARGLTYKDAGVDIDAKMRAISRIKLIARGTFGKGVLSDIGSFGGLFDLTTAGAFRHPVLVGSADGVGTKLKIAFMTGNHRTVGMDLVNHCVNDILVQGAVPLFFLDYIAMGRVEPQVIIDLATGLARACRESGCALIGGETAEMPDFYGAGEYDVAGFIVGVVDRDKVIDGSRIAAGDVLIGLPSTGLHTNGYSLARKIFFEKRGFKPETRVPELGRTVADELLAVHRAYLQPLRGLLASGAIYGMAHITGGGFTDNIPRILPRGVSARVHAGSWPVLPVFSYMKDAGRIGDEEMFRTFNMGIGMVLVVPIHRETEVRAHLDKQGEKHYRIGEVVAGNRRVLYETGPVTPA